MIGCAGGGVRGIDKPMTMLEIYQAAVAEGRLHEDPAQLGVMAELERVRVEVAVPVKRGMFRKAPPPVQGLYIWGFSKNNWGVFGSKSDQDSGRPR